MVSTATAQGNNSLSRQFVVLNWQSLAQTVTANSATSATSRYVQLDDLPFSAILLFLFFCFCVAPPTHQVISTLFTLMRVCRSRVYSFLLFR